MDGLIAATSAILATAALEPGATFRDCEVCPQLVVVAGGTYLMGAQAPADQTDEHPEHLVKIAAFAAGISEVTVGEFARFVTATGHDAGSSCSLIVDGAWTLTASRSWRNPGYPQQDDYPVACVSWQDAMAFVDWISAQAGAPYRLLSEAEWEFLARAGGDDAPVNGKGGEWEFAAPAGGLGPDRYGLHDVRGNVWEWLADCYHDSYHGAPTDGSARTQGCSHPDRRALRGGSWNDGPELLRSGYRLRGPAGGRYYTLGFRVARDLP